ncbi:F0F1 ATP synthase subunit B [Alphaproteobacteria bacterium]|nr:F0F1 ATP synthase subunit B [Alphaproteobacteria bacterium]
MADPTHDAGLLADSNFWVAVSFVIFAGIVWKFGKGAIISMLDGRIEKIKSDIATAENLRVEAQELLAQYQRKQRDAEKEAARILDDAKKNAAQIKKDAEKELKESVKRKEKQLEERVIRMQQNAVEEIQAYAADLAIKATTEIVMDSLDKKANAKLVDEAIKDVKQLH